MEMLVKNEYKTFLYSQYILNNLIILNVHIWYII
jgi:hypothetical protein